MAVTTYKIAVAEDVTHCKAYNDIKDYAKCEVIKKWGIDQWSAFDYIIQKESNWNYKADNPHSSAYGLPQAMTSLHDLPEDYMTNPKSQILWALDYIDTTYSDAQKAKEFHKKHNWY